MSTSDTQAPVSTLSHASQERASASPAAASITQELSRAPSSALFNTAPIASTPPPFSVTIEDHLQGPSENMNQSRSTNGATAQNLLNLLNFGGPLNATAAPAQAQSVTSAGPAVPAAPQPTSAAPLSASDLVARFMSPTVSTPRLEQKEARLTATQATMPFSQNPLLELLSKQANALSEQSDVDAEETSHQLGNPEDPVQSIETADDADMATHEEQQQENPVRIFGTTASREPTPFEPTSASPSPKEAKPIFTYTNPFEALNASRHQTPAAKSPAPLQTDLPTEFGAQEFGALSSPAEISARKKLTPKLRSQRSTSAAPREQSPLPKRFESQDAESSSPSNQKDQRKTDVPASAQQHHAELDQVETIILTQNQEPITEDTSDKQDDSGEWEDAEDLPEKDDVLRRVSVYNFPIKAFVSITLHLGESSDIGIREDGVMEISRLKKEFDQLDRSLTAATDKYITYAFAKNGGMRIIRQDDGSDRHVFKNSHDRIFNVAFCSNAMSGPPSDNHAVLGTGVSGAVYYANVSKEGNDLFEKNQLDSESLIFSPFPQADENTAGGVLKTRSKRSSRHPEYFAIGRGKSIQLVWPATALSPRYGINNANRTVDVAKFYSDRPLQISTGKTGKDFTFSEDDTVIVSLDKTGRLRFWDIRDLVDESNATAARVTPVVIDTPLLSLSTASPAEKSWPTSVTFVDKARPYRKGGALRYVLVGLRQNHTLQLWDIALGKAVQELNFPHEKETDGICSVNYHPESGIIVVSHPTRNSIFFIHLSAPRYTLGTQLNQATYVQRIAAKDPEIPKPESTACMSGIREISFAEKGQLRSVELLPVQKSVDAAKDEFASLFELYVVHSKGVTCLAISKDDLGWDADSKVKHPIDAQEEGLVTLKDLKLGSVIEEPVRSKSPPKETQQATKAAKKKSKKSGQPAEDNINGVEEPQQTTSVPTQNVIVVAEDTQPELVTQDVPVPKETKKARKKAERAAQASEQLKPTIETGPISSSPREPVPDRNGKAASPLVEDTPASKSRATGDGISTQWLSEELKKIELVISATFNKELDSLYQNVQNDRAAQESSSASRQEAILRLVSSSLSTNVEKSLSRILAQQMQQSVVPAVVQQASAQIAETLASFLKQDLPREISTSLPNAVNTALQNPQVSKTIADSVTQKLSKHIETQVSDTVVKAVSPVFKNIAIGVAEKASSDTEARLSLQIRQLQLDRAADNEKIDRLGNVLQGMAATLQVMSDSQVAFQGQILKDRQVFGGSSSTGMINTSRQVSTARGTPDPISVNKLKPTRIKSKADLELEEITSLMNDGRYEEGSIRWLQSAQPVKLFDELFVRFTPEYLATDVSPLVAFSIAVTVASSLSTNTERRLEWISAAFDAVDIEDPEIADLSEHAPSLITSLVQKLESLYMTVAERNPGDPVLRGIPSLAKKARDMKTSFMARAAGPIAPALPRLTSAHFH